MVTTFIMLVGLPASGKSTCASKLTNVGYKVFSSDEYRKRVLGNEEDQSNNAKVFEELNKDVVLSLGMGTSCVYDATNVTIKDRGRILRQIEGLSCRKIAYVVGTPIEECIKRNENRDRKVPREVIYNMACRFQFPMKYEGFDSIDIVNSSLDGELVETMDKMIGFDQQNPHHKYPLMEHCLRLASNYDKTQIEYLAALLHDIGKVFTQKIDENGVAHYYNHDSIGAYYLVTQFSMLVFLWEKLGNKMEHEKEIDTLYDAIFFVNWHMRAHRDLVGEKAQKKYKELFGKEKEKNYFERLMQFAEYDKVASGTYKQ